MKKYANVEEEGIAPELFSDFDMSEDETLDKKSHSKEENSLLSELQVRLKLEIAEIETTAADLIDMIAGKPVYLLLPENIRLLLHVGNEIIGEGQIFSREGKFYVSMSGEENE